MNELLFTSYVEGDKRVDVVEGVISVGTLRWEATSFLPPFKEPPEIILVSKTGKERTPSISSITKDAFTVKINSSDQAGKWVWRARGELLKQTGRSENLEISGNSENLGTIKNASGLTVITIIKVLVLCFIVLAFIFIIFNINNDNWQNNIILYVVVGIITAIIVALIIKIFQR